MMDWGVKRHLGLMVVVFFLTEISYSQCTLTSALDTEAEVLSCLSSCGCQELVIPDGVTIDMDGDWDLLSEGAITFTIQGSGSLVFSGAGGNRDEVFLASGSVLIIEDTNNTNALASSPPSGGNTRLEIGGQVYQGNDFEAIIMAGGADENGVLPIILSRFSLEVKMGKVLVSWQTSSELNNDFFTVEKSKNGVEYYTVRTVEGAGNSDSVLDYSYLDNLPYEGQSYYRLKQTDFDGNFEIFSPASIFINPSHRPVMSVMPNPKREGESFEIRTGFRNEEEVRLTIFNSNGHMVENQLFTKPGVSMQVTKELIPGLYLITIHSRGVKKSTKLLVQ